MTKEELLQYSADQVRRSKELFDEYERIYKEELGRLPDCSSCSFSAVFNKWKRESIMVKEQKKYDNTFKLNQNYSIIYVPGKGEVITANSSDELAIEFLTQEDCKYFENRAKLMFEKLPDGIDEKGNVTPEADQLPETISSIGSYAQEETVEESGNIQVNAAVIEPEGVQVEVKEEVTGAKEEADRVKAPKRNKRKKVKK